MTNTVISSTVQNNTLNDIATALTNSIAANGETPITANIPMATHKITGLAAATTSGDALAYGQTGASIASLTVTTTLTGPGGVITSGVYTPTDASAANCTIVLVNQFMYQRVGGIISGWGSVVVTPSSSGVNCTFSLTLPVAGTVLLMTGVLTRNASAESETGIITTSSDLIQVQFRSRTTTEATAAISFAYQV